MAPSPLDPALPALKNPYTPWARRALWLFIACLIIAFGGAPLLSEGVRILIGALGFVAASALGFTLWYLSRDLEPKLEAFRRGERLASWAISRDRFEVWAAQRQQKIRKGAAAAGALTALGGGVAALLFWEDGELALAAKVAVASVSAGLLLSLLILRVSRLSPPGTGDVLLILGRDTAWFAGACLSWRGFGLHFESAAVVADPPTLQIIYEVRTKNGPVRQTLELPVPPESAAEAEAVAAAIRAAPR